MPYTRQELLAAVRQDHPQLANVPDNQLFAAIAVDHPDLARGISELQQPAPQQGGSSENMLDPRNMADMLTGVNPATFGERIMGGIASVVNPMLPGGDTRRPNAQLPEMTPQEQVGEKTTVLASTVPLVEALGSLIPNAKRAGGKLNQALAVAKETPLDLTEADKIAQRASELSQSGTTLPKTFRDYLRVSRQSTYPPFTEMNFGRGRDFAVNAGRLSATERAASNPPMHRLTSQFAKALSEANQQAATSSGVGKVFNEGMKEYRQAMAVKDATETLVSALKKYGVKAAATGAGVGAGYGLYKHFVD